MLGKILSTACFADLCLITVGLTLGDFFLPLAEAENRTTKLFGEIL